MNWYKKLAQRMDQQSLQELNNIVENEIWLPLSQKNQQMSNQAGNQAVNKVFINLGNIARNISRNCQMGNPQSALQSCNDLQQQLGRVAKFVDVQSIQEAIQNARIYVNDLMTRARQPKQQPQPRQQVRQQVPMPAAA